MPLFYFLGCVLSRECSAADIALHFCAENMECSIFSAAGPEGQRPAHVQAGTQCTSSSGTLQGAHNTPDYKDRKLRKTCISATSRAEGKVRPCNVNGFTVIKFLDFIVPHKTDRL